MVENSKEMVWQVDKDGQRVGPVLRKDAHNIDTSIGVPENWVIHEEVGLLVVSKDDGVSVLFQLRSKDKKVMPNTWSTGVAGHVEWKEGEEQEPEASNSRESAVLREAEEEIDLKGLTLTYLGRYFDVGPKEARWKYMFRAEVSEDYPFVVNPDEVEEVRFFNKQELDEAIARGEEFYEPFVELVRAFWSGEIDTKLIQ